MFLLIKKDYLFLNIARPVKGNNINKTSKGN